MSKSKPDNSHKSPYDRGGADAYYYRPYDPHCYKRVDHRFVFVDIEDMTEQQILDYKNGYENAIDDGFRKNYQ